MHLPVCTVGVAGLLELGLTGFWTRVLVLVPLVSIVATAAGWSFFDLVEARFHNRSIARPRPKMRQSFGAGDEGGVERVPRGGAKRWEMANVKFEIPDL